MVAVNRFSADTPAETAALEGVCARLGVETVMADHWAQGGAGAADLARAVARIVERGEARFRPLYPDDMPLWDKLRTVAREIYGAADIAAEPRVRARFDELQDAGFGHFPVCVAKTQYSFSTDPEAKGAPDGHIVPVREVRLAGGAGFAVAVCGDIMTMPGLPRRPAAEGIGVDARGRIEGLF